MMARSLLAPVLAFACSDAIGAQGVAPPGLSATGTWSGELAIGGLAQTVTVQLHRRQSGAIQGYVIGGASGRAIAQGSQTEAGLAFDIEIADPLLTRTISLSAAVGPHSLVGVADDGGAVTPIHWQKVHPELVERRFLFASAAGGGDAGSIVEMAVVRRKGSGAFVGGAFVGLSDCELFACGGAVVGFVESTDGLGNETIAVELATGGGCPGFGSLEATFDPVTKLYAGEYSFSDCSGETAGLLLGAKAARASSRDAALVLAAFDQLASALESGTVLRPSDVPLSADYLHLGATRDDRLAEYNAEIATYGELAVDFNRFRSLHTVADPDILSELARPFSVDFRDRRAGTLGGVPVVYRDVDTKDGADELKFLARKGSGWRIHGNQVTHDLPFAGYSFGPAHVIVPTAGGDVFVSIGPWGAHDGPHTGHHEGNAKADWFGLYAHSLEQLVELAGDGNGICEPGEICGLSAADLEARIVDFVAPSGPFEVTEVRLQRLESSFGSDEHWRLRGRVAYYEYDFVHLREISADLRHAMITAGYTDPWTVHLPSGNLITGAPVILAAGEAIARPQAHAEEIPGHPGFYRGKFGVPEAPWQQMEFFTFNADTSRQESFYTWLAPSLEESLAGVLEADGLDPKSFRYNQPHLNEARWKAQMALSNQAWMSRDDYSTLFSALGGWWENTAGTCDGASVECDELFSIFPIRKDTAFYSPGLYESPDVSFLAIHAHAGGVPPTRFGEVVAPAAPDPIFGSLVVKWRGFDGAELGYQGLGYRLDIPGRTLRITWGAMAPLAAAVVLPAVPENTDPCDGSSLTCHNHDRPGG